MTLLFFAFVVFRSRCCAVIVRVSVFTHTHTDTAMYPVLNDLLIPLLPSRLLICLLNRITRVCFA